MSDRATSLRTHTCGELRRSDAGRDVALCGWVAHRRDQGGVTFVDLRDRDGIVQVVFHKETSAEALERASSLKTESVVRVKGEVRPRPEGTVNPDLPTGEIEVLAANVEVLSEAETPPFLIEDRAEIDEAIRLKYRYLDIRRPEVARMMQLRARVNDVIRRYFERNGFVEVETPMLTRSTPEGARDFLVPSRLSPGEFYALPQSPQLFKQILMVAGLDRYYQIVRCFRDEDLRADRQPEFTQLDVEMSFVQEEDVIAMIEPLIVELVRETNGVEVQTPFPRLTYAEAADRYGSDKPDLRYGMELVDLSPVFANTGFRVFANTLADGGVIKAIVVPGAASLSRRELDDLVTEAKGRGASGLVWMAFDRSDIRTPVSQHISPEELGAVAATSGAADGDLVLIVADKPTRVAVALDGLRRHMAEKMSLIPDGEWAFVWVTEPPLFEWAEDEGKWSSVHHPFTSPATDDLAPETAKARGYDLVLNGVELGGGSIRIHRTDVQRRVFEALGLGRDEAEEKFGFLLRAFRYGVPPHGGIAFGMDRIVMMLAGQDNIREVIAFPKTQTGTDPLTGAPADVPDEQLRDLGLQKRQRAKGPT